MLLATTRAWCRGLLGAAITYRQAMVQLEVDELEHGLIELKEGEHHLQQQHQ
jgi:hypothetical protein